MTKKKAMLPKDKPTCRELGYMLECADYFLDKALSIVIHEPDMGISVYNKTVKAIDTLDNLRVFFREKWMDTYPDTREDPFYIDDTKVKSFLTAYGADLAFKKSETEEN